MEGASFNNGRAGEEQLDLQKLPVKTGKPERGNDLLPSSTNIGITLFPAPHFRSQKVTNGM